MQLDQSITNNKELDDRLKSLFGGKDHTQDRTDKFKGTVKDFFTRVAMDKTFSLGSKSAGDMNPDEFKTALRQKLIEQFRSMKVRGDDGNEVALTQWYKEVWAPPISFSLSAFSATGTAAKRKVAGLPDDPEKLPEYLADKALKQMDDRQLETLRTARVVTDSDYDIGSLLELASRTPGVGPRLLVAGNQYRNGYNPPARADSEAPSAPLVGRRLPPEISRA